MIRLRKILLSNYLYLVIIIIVLLISFFRINTKYKSSYNTNIKNITGIISKYSIDGDKLSITIDSKEDIIGTYYFQSMKEKESFSKKFKLGDKVKLSGELNKIRDSTTKNIYNYKFYMNNKKIFYSISISKIKLISKNTNIYYIFKNFIIKRLNNNPYLYTFILGDKTYLKKEVTASYQNNGISHLFAISGMHIALLSGLILKILKKLKIKEEKRYLITSIFLISYLLITGFSISILRGVLFFLLFTINKIYYFYIKAVNIFILTLAISLTINPFYLYEVAFWYSFLISFSLILLSKFISHFKNYFSGLLVISIISFLISLPISLYNFYQINLLSIIYNLFYVPFISIIVFPVSLISFIIPLFIPIFNILVFILEKSSLFLNNIDFLTFIFKKLPLIIYLLYFIFIWLIYFGIIYKKKVFFLPFVFLIISHYLIPVFDNSTYIKMIDVSQGDSILLVSRGKAILIDTGGIMSYSNSSWQKKNNQYSLVKSITIPLLKSLGIKKISYLILTHGDYDHLGESINLIDNFNVEKIIINSGNINYLEKELINRYNNIYIGEELFQIECNDIKLIQLNKSFLDENDSSQIYYATFKGKKMLFMGDGSIKSEEYLLDTYDFSSIDILKVGHHGSRTSSSYKFLKKIKPKISLISAGVDNKFSHPHQEVVDNLEKFSSYILQTKKLGTVTIDLDNNLIYQDG